MNSKKINFLMSNIKKIGILTSGGDCGGLNAAIRSIFLELKRSTTWRFLALEMGRLD